jgi:hypothetical protein
MDRERGKAITTVMGWRRVEISLACVLFDDASGDITLDKVALAARRLAKRGRRRGGRPS